MWTLVRDSGVLEANSCYAYMLLCTHFADTCLVAERDGRGVGFVAAYRPPTHPDAVFVWQVGVSAEARGQGLGKRLLHALLRSPGCRDVHFLEATVGSSNVASQRLFRAVARELGVDCAVQRGFSGADFGPLAHEDEELFRIGPIRRNP
ncbi:MAG: diaminobutyrate acetyltransferase [Deltaproteobacteria bacterium]|nr:diaminobutyrate acetyltransferase [Deltaproteobacteria bacterium]MCB9786635.1 diaminobutyrate acetyltransferase [Deltaproteobacteria bacterium]